jgi:hypothetical protein
MGTVAGLGHASRARDGDHRASPLPLESGAARVDNAPGGREDVSDPENATGDRIPEVVRPCNEATGKCTSQAGRQMTTRLRIPLTDGTCASKSFARELKREIEGLESGVLPLHRGTFQGGQVDDRDISATIVSVAERADVILARVGVFFNEVVGGCSCGDDPSSENAYCEIQVRIDKETGEMDFDAIPQ